MTANNGDTLTMSDDAPAGLGHNRPPLIVGPDLELRLLDAHAEVLDRADELKVKGEPFKTVTTDEEDSASTEFMVKLRACWKAAESARQAEKAPYDQGAGEVHAFFKTRVLDSLKELGDLINEAQTKFKLRKAEEERQRRIAEQRKREEEERKAREERERTEREAREAERAAARKRNEAARIAAEAEAKAKGELARQAAEAESKAAAERAKAQEAATAPASELSRARGGRGGVSSLRSSITFRDLDRETVNLEALRPYLTDAAIEAAVNGWIKANRGIAEAAIRPGGKQPLKGVVIFEKFSNAGRA